MFKGAYHNFASEAQMKSPCLVNDVCVGLIPSKGRAALVDVAVVEGLAPVVAWELIKRSLTGDAHWENDHSFDYVPLT